MYKSWKPDINVPVHFFFFRIYFLYRTCCVYFRKVIVGGEIIFLKVKITISLQFCIKDTVFKVYYMVIMNCNIMYLLYLLYIKQKIVDHLLCHAL